MRPITTDVTFLPIAQSQPIDPFNPLLVATFTTGHACTHFTGPQRLNASETRLSVYFYPRFLKAALNVFEAICGFWVDEYDEWYLLI